MNSFDSLGLIDPINRAIKDAKYETMTPIQARAIPPLLEGHDVLGCAQTGTGKTAAFLLPVLQHLERTARQGKPKIRALVLTPTRELAAQIGDNFKMYAKYLELRHLVVFGGVKQGSQVTALRRGVDVLIATPGRLLDLQSQGFIRLDQIEFFILDEADRMLDMGFIRDIRKVLALLPEARQNLLFSATMPDSIVKLANTFLTEPVRVEVDRRSTTVERIDQKVMFVSRADKKRLLQSLLTDDAIESAIVFTRTKHGADRVVKQLARGGIQAAAIHGNKSQNNRTRALAGFKSGRTRVLVATDIASRGIDVDGVSHVFNYDLPNIAESYVHRIGRTARAGREGVAIAFCDETEVGYLADIEGLTGKPLDVVEEHEWHHVEAMEAKRDKVRPKGPESRNQSQRGGRSSGGGGGRGQRKTGQTGDRGRTGDGESSANEGRRRRRNRNRNRNQNQDRDRAQSGGENPAQAGASPSNKSDSNPKPNRRRRRRRRPNAGSDGPSTSKD